MTSVLSIQINSPTMRIVYQNICFFKNKDCHSDLFESKDRDTFILQGKIIERSQNTVLLTSTQETIKPTAVQCGAHSVTDFTESRATSRVAHSFCSDKLYICLSNKWFNCIQRICCVTDIRPSQDHQILRICNRHINLASSR